MMARVEHEMLVAVDGREWPVKGAEVSLPVPNLHIGRAVFSSNMLVAVDGREWLLPLSVIFLFPPLRRGR